ncbi:MAG TPA: TonB-dependent receptor [Gemmatimonadaceae bacterium]|nr:TonB-dependent receptor [Gemmatimonadaceae bacterium]
MLVRRSPLVRVARALLGFLPLLAPPTVLAQERPDSARRVERLEGVVITGTRTPATVGGAGALVVRPDSLRTAPAPLLADVLRETPFVLVRQNSRGEAELSVRGSDSRQAAVLLDGMPLTLGWDHRADPSLVPVSGVQSLTLVRGLSSLLHGPNALGGVIEVRIASGAGGEPARDRAWASAGIDRQGGRALSLGASVPRALGSGLLVVRAGGGYREREGFRVPRAAGDSTAVDALRTNSDLLHRDLFAALRWRGEGGRFVGVTASGMRAERGVPPELHVQAPRLWRYPEQARFVAALSGGTGVTRTPFGVGTLEVTGGWNAGALEIESFGDRRYETVTARERGDERTLTARAVASHSLGAGELRVAHTTADVRYEETLGEASPSDYRQRLHSTGAELTWPLGARVALAGGAVRDAASTPETGGRESLGPVDAWGWRAGATLRASEALRLHASASRRARFPALRELYSGALDRFRPNPLLRPERLTGVELGATLEQSGRFAVQAVGFHHRLRDAVVRTTVPGTRLFVRVNRDVVRSAGLELLGDWRSSSVAARAVTLGADLLAQQVRVHDDSARAERRAEHQPEVRGAMELGVPLPAALRATGGVRYTGAQYCVHPDLGAQVRLGAQAAGHVAVERRWPIGRGGGIFGAARAVLALDNVTDAAVYDQCGLPQPGRTLRLGVQLH